MGAWTVTRTTVHRFARPTGMASSKPVVGIEKRVPTPSLPRCYSIAEPKVRSRQVARYLATNRSTVATPTSSCSAISSHVWSPFSHAPMMRSRRSIVSAASIAAWDHTAIPVATGSRSTEAAAAVSADSTRATDASRVAIPAEALAKLHELAGAAPAPSTRRREAAQRRHRWATATSWTASRRSNGSRVGPDRPPTAGASDTARARHGRAEPRRLDNMSSLRRLSSFGRGRRAVGVTGVS
jgi:hypothetical protein